MTFHQLIGDNWKIKGLIIVRRGYLTFRSYTCMPVSILASLVLIRVVLS